MGMKIKGFGSWVYPGTTAFASGLPTENVEASRTTFDFVGPTFGTGALCWVVLCAALRTIRYVLRAAKGVGTNQQHKLHYECVCSFSHWPCIGAMTASLRGQKKAGGIRCCLQGTSRLRLRTCSSDSAALQFLFTIGYVGGSLRKARLLWGPVPFRQFQPENFHFASYSRALIGSKAWGFGVFR